MPTVEELDAALLACIPTRWGKVAMVLGQAAKQPGLFARREEEDYDLLAERLELLVASGLVLAQGDLKQWRASEVRLSQEGGRA
jgi:hypothetical protein